MSKRRDALPPNLPPRGLNREQAAEYIGIGVTLFDERVASGLLPPARTGGIFGRRRVWDRFALDKAAFASEPAAYPQEHGYAADSEPVEWRA